MRYPVSPWKFKRLGLTIFYLLPVRHIKALVPAPLKISEVVPGFTLGGVYAARYGKPGSAANEFGMLPAYVKYAGRKGFFLHEFCADGERAGGSRRLMGPGMSRPDFTWGMDEKFVSLEVSRGGEPLLNLKMHPIIKELPFSASIAFICVKGENIVFFKNQFASNIGFAKSTVTFTDNSPLKIAPFNLKLVSAFWDASNIVVNEPEYITEAAFKQPDRAFGSPMGRQGRPYARGQRTH